MKIPNKNKIFYSQQLKEQFEEIIKIPIEDKHLEKIESLIDANWTAIEGHMTLLKRGD
jgi:hypothetical protein